MRFLRAVVICTLSVFPFAGALNGTHANPRRSAYQFPSDYKIRDLGDEFNFDATDNDGNQLSYTLRVTIQHTDSGGSQYTRADAQNVVGAVINTASGHAFAPYTYNAMVPSSYGGILYASLADGAERDMDAVDAAVWTSVSAAFVTFAGQQLLPTNFRTSVMNEDYEEFATIYMYWLPQ